MPVARAARSGGAGLLLVGVLLTGCTGTTGGQGLYTGWGRGPATSDPADPPSAPPTSEAPTTEAPTSAPPTTDPPTTTTSTTSAAPPPTTTSPPPPPPGGQLSDDGWVVDSFVYADGGIGLFSGDATVRNDGADGRSMLCTFTLFDGEAIVATFVGSVAEVPAGEIAEVALISGDPYVEGDFSVDFEVDISF